MGRVVNFVDVILIFILTAVQSVRQSKVVANVMTYVQYTAIVTVQVYITKCKVTKYICHKPNTEFTHLVVSSLIMI